MINNKTSKNHHTSHQKSNVNSKCMQSSSLKSRDSGLSPEPRYEKHFNENECGEFSSTQALSNDISELKTRLLKEENEKDQLKLQVQHLFEEKNITEKHLEAINTAYEMRITEMRCVIVELQNRLKSQQSTAIMEESEHEDGSELSFQEGSVYNSEAETNSCNDPRIERDEQQQKSKIAIQETTQKYIKKEKPSYPFMPHMTTPDNSLQVQSLQEEILTLRSQIALLQSEIATRDNFYEKGGSNPESNQNFDCKYQEPENKSIYINKCEKNDDDDDELKAILKTPHRNISEDFCVPIMKVAERVKLKQIAEDNLHSTNLHMENDEVIEELSEHLRTNLDINATRDPKSVHKELKQLYRRIEHFKLQNSILSLNLTENKQHCNFLYLLCGKYESNAIALQEALNYSDRAIEAYDVMLALLESKLAVLENIEYAEENRNTAETVAHLLLNRFKKEISIYGKSSAPWLVDEPEIENQPWTEDHDQMLRSQVSKLKGQRSLVQNTVVNLESPFCANAAADIEIDKNLSNAQCKLSQRSKNIEMTILMQEVASLREEICELKLQAEQSEDNKRITQQKFLLQVQGDLHLPEINKKSI